METFIRYILISTCCLSVLYIGYLIFQKKGKRLNQHRYYLLISIFISIIMPFTTFQITTTKSSDKTSITEVINHKIETVSNITDDTFINQATLKTESHNNYNISLFLKAIYFTVLSILLLRLFTQFFSIYKLAKACRSIKQERSRLLYNDKITNPFTFFNLIFIPSDYLNTNENKDILKHESIHATQYHSLDLLLVELLMAIMWFNPLVWMMKKTIQSVHEYLADEGVLNTGTDKLRYQALLINQVTEERLICLSSSFNQSLIKKRIMMMTKSKIDQGSKLRILALIPLAIVVFIAVACVNGQQAASNGVTLVEPVNMNVLYAGVDNPVKISTSGYNVSDLKVTIDNGTISGKNGEYIIKPQKIGPANVLISYKGKEITKSIFRVKQIPTPVAMIAGIKGGKISKEKLLEANAIKPMLENFDFDVRPEIVGFNIQILKYGYLIQEFSKSNKITDKQKQLLKNINEDQEVFIKNIKCKTPDGTLRELPVIDLIITE